MANELISDKIVFSVRDDSVRKKLLTSPDLTLQEAINVCQVAEQTDIRILIMKDTDRLEEHVNAIKNTKCNYCGGMHERLKRKNRNKCPAFGKVCRNCDRKNHFAHVCKHKEEKSEEKSCNWQTRTNKYLWSNTRIIQNYSRIKRVWW